MDQMSLFSTEVINTPMRTNYSEDSVIRKSKDLIQEARHSLTGKELKLVDFLISKIRESDEQLVVVDTSIKEINEICHFGTGGAASRNTADAIFKLTDKQFKMVNKDGYLTVGRWIEKPYLKNGKIKLKLDAELLPHLLGLPKEQITMYRWRDVVDLKTAHAQRLYQRLKSYESQDVVEISKSDMMEMFRVNSKTTEWYRLTKYIQKAVEDISTLSPMKLTYSTKKEGRNVVAAVFTIERKEEFVINDNEKSSQN